MSHIVGIHRHQFTDGKVNIASNVAEVAPTTESVRNETLKHSSHTAIVKPQTVDTSFLLPAGAFDTHVHVFDPRLGPYSPTRSYTPESASFSSLTTFSKTLSKSTPTLLATFVLVQPSPYRNDNRVLLQTLKQCRKDGLKARAIAVVDISTVTDNDLSEMHELGVRGLRLNMQADGHNIDTQKLGRLLVVAAGRVSKLPGWALQVYAPAHIWEGLHDIIMNLPVPVITDHIGGLLGESKLPLEHINNPLQQPGFQALLSLAKSSRIFIKISGLYRASSDQQSAYADMEPILRKLFIEVPDNLIWGSDWPHTGEGKDRARNKNIEVPEPFRVIDNLGILKNLRAWSGGDETWTKMMISNPSRLFK